MNKYLLLGVIIYNLIDCLYIYNTAILIKICHFLINVVKFTQTLTKLDLPTLRKGSIEERTQRTQRVSDFLFVPLRPFFYAALTKRWKVQFRKGLRKFNEVD